MKVKWKCVWKVLKPKVIAALLTIIVAIIFIIGMFLLFDYLFDYLISIAPSTDFKNMSLQDRQGFVSTSSCCGLSPMAIVLPVLIIIGGISIIFLSIEYLKALAEALKPCIIWKEE